MENFRIPFRPSILSAYVDLKSGDVDFNWEIFRKFLQVQNYFIGVYENITEDEKFEKVESEFFRWLWCLGELFITTFNNEIQLWQINKKECDGIHIKKVLCKMITKDLQLYQINNTDEVEFVNFKQGLYVCWNPVVFPAIVLWWNYLGRICRLEKQFLNNTIWDGKKFIYTMNNQDGEIVNKEIESFSDPDTPFIKNVSPPSMQGKSGLSSNIFTQLDLGVSQSDQAYNNLINYQNYVWNMMGMMSPVNLKKERKTTSEATLDIYNTLNIEYITLRELNKFAKNAKKVLGLDLEFMRTTDIMETTDNDDFREKEDGEKGWEDKV